MARLTKMPSRMVSMPRRMPVPGDERERDRQRYALKPWRKWYATKRWADLRLAKLMDAGWTCQQTGVLLVAKHPAPHSPVLDHIKPHNGDPALFWDPDNLQVVSKEWHDRDKQKIERGARGPGGG